MGLMYWLKIKDSVNEKLNTVKPFARSANGKISTVYLISSASET